MSAKAKALVEDLYHVPENGKAEIVNGELVLMPPTGDEPSRSGGEIYFSLRQYEQNVGGGYAYPDNAGFIVDLPGRRSFSPDAAWFTGRRKGGGKFLEGTPIFAAEVRSEGDYGPAAEHAMFEKRRDYFAAGTLVVWDVDVLRERVVRVYRAGEPENPAVYGTGETAEAESAVPGWRLAVDDLFS